MKIENKVQNNLALLNNTVNNKQPGKGKPGKEKKQSLYPSLPPGEGGPPRDIEGAEHIPLTPTDAAPADPQDGSGGSGQDAAIKPVSPRPATLRARLTALCTRGAKYVRHSLCATAVVSVILLACILVLRELGWLALHHIPVEELETSIVGVD